MLPQPRRNGRRVARLHEDGARTRKLADEPLAAAHVGDDAAGCGALEDVVAVPRHQMAIVDDIFLAVAELYLVVR